MSIRSPHTGPLQPGVVAGAAEWGGPSGARFLAAVRGILQDWSARVGGVMVALVVVVALVGPFFAPHSPSELLSRPYASPQESGLLFGADYLGRDAFSRFLWGGRMLIVLALFATSLSYVVGIGLGLLAAFHRGRLADLAIIGGLDIVLAFPPLLFVLVLLSTKATSPALIVPAVAGAFVPRIARVVRGAALEIMTRDFVTAARARGETLRWILGKEVLPNIRRPILADLGIRLTASIVLIASVGFLGLGQQPPAADWGRLVSENRAGLVLQPWSVAAPIAAIAALTLGVNLVADGLVRWLGHSEARADG